MDQLDECSSSYQIWLRTYNTIKKGHESVCKIIDESLILAQQNENHAALQRYEDAIRFIDKTLAIQVECPDSPDATWSELCQIVQNLKQMHRDTRKQIAILQKSLGIEPSESPPTTDLGFEEVRSVEEGITPVSARSVEDLATTFELLKMCEKGTSDTIFSCENVQVFFISSDEEVSCTLEPQTLKVISVTSPEKARSFQYLEIGDIIYPLLSGVSPCIQTDYGAFILPNIESKVAGSAIGLVLPEGTDEETFGLLRNLLGLKDDKPEALPLSRAQPYSVEEPEDVGENISNALVTGANYVAKGLMFCAEKAAGAISYGTPRLINYLNPAPSTATVSAQVSKSIAVTNSVSSTLVKATGFVADQVCFATWKLGEFLAPHIQEKGAKLLTSGFGMDEETASKHINSGLAITTGAVQSFATVYGALESSAGILGATLKDSSVQIVKHKYGEQASSAVGESMATAGNIYKISQNVRILRPKKMAKNLVKSTVSNISVAHASGSK